MRAAAVTLEPPGEVLEEALVIVVYVAATHIPAVAGRSLSDERGEVPAYAVVRIRLHDVRRVCFQGACDSVVELGALVITPALGV